MRTPCVTRKKENSPGKRSVLGFMVVVLIVALWGSGLQAQTSKRSPMPPRTFESPEAAVEALVNAAKSDNERELLAILGPEGERLIASGDSVADQQGRACFVQFYESESRLVRESPTKAVLEIGGESWPLPIPVVRKHNLWQFDTRAGFEEIINRRIGQNELGAIHNGLAYVAAQHEYAALMRELDGRRRYAQKFISEPGMKDGLYWAAGEGEPQSPLAARVADAQKEGYRKKEGDHPTPYHGYIYRILKAQGRNARYGAYDYVVDGNMIGGFALVAYPAVYGVSGIMTFIVNDEGAVYEKNLGKATEAIGLKMKRFDPDKSWHPVDSRFLSP